MIYFVIENLSLKYNITHTIKSQSKKYAFIAAWVLLSTLGIYIANKTYQSEIIVKGILGFAVLYLLFFYLRFSGIDAPIDTMLLDPKIYKYLIYAFIGPGIAYWAMGGIFEMISMVVKNWLSF